MTVPPDARTAALARVDAPSERAVFSLEMGRDGVLLRLPAAALGSLLVIRDLVLRVGNVQFPFDYTSGPRALSSHLSTLSGAVLEVRFQGILERIRPAGIELVRMSGEAGSVVIQGRVDGVPFTVRVEVRVSPHGGGADVLLNPRDPRVYGLVGIAWNRLSELLKSTIPAALQVGGRGTAVGLRILRPALTALLTPMGFKVPLLRDAAVTSVEVLPHGIRLSFGPAGPARGLPEFRLFETAPEVGNDAEGAALEAMKELARGGADGSVLERFLQAGIAVQRLWPEVLARAWAAAEERPEAVLPNLVAALLAPRFPDLVGAGDRTKLARRLLAAVDGPGESVDAGLAAGLVASLSDGLAPHDAVEVLARMRARGAPDPAILLASARALDRVGRRDEARPLRLRALAVTPSGDVGRMLGAEIDQLMRSGLEDAATAWLDEVIAACDDGRFGSESGPVRRRARLVRAAQDAMGPGDGDGPRRRVKELQAEDPSDPEVLELLLSLSTTDRDVAEAVAGFRAAAEKTSGAARAGLLRTAGLAMSDRLGLRRQAAQVLEEARQEAPGDDALAEALDRVYEALSWADRRLALVEERLQRERDPAVRVRLVGLATRLAEETGQAEVAARTVTEWMDLEPTGREPLLAGRRVFSARGDTAALHRVLGSLADLAKDPEERARLEAELAELEQRGAGGEAADELDRMDREASRVATDVREGLAALGAGDPERAWVLASSALALDADDVSAMRLAVQAGAAAGRLDDAVAACERLASRRFEPDEQAEALLDLADLSVLATPGSEGPILARLARAIPGDPRVLEAARRLAPEALAAVLTAGVEAVVQAGDPAAIRRCVAQLYEGAALLWDERSAPAEAAGLLEQILCLQPDHGPSRSDLATLYRVLGREEEGRALEATEGGE